MLVLKIYSSSLEWLIFCELRVGEGMHAHMTKCNASCSQNCTMSSHFECFGRRLPHNPFPCNSMTFSNAMGLFYICWNCVASLCIYLVLINVSQSCKSLCLHIVFARHIYIYFCTLSISILHSPALYVSICVYVATGISCKRMIFTKFKGLSSLHI